MLKYNKLCTARLHKLLITRTIDYVHLGAVDIDFLLIN